MKKSLDRVLSELKHLPDRTSGMAFGDAAVQAFAEVSPYRDGAAHVSYYAGSSEWERHPHGDEIVMGMAGASTVIRLLDGREERCTLVENELVVVPVGVWHRFEDSVRLKVMTVTPQPTEHRLERPEG